MMPTFWLDGFRQLGKDANNTVAPVLAGVKQNDKVTLSGSSQAITCVKDVYLVRVHADAACYMAFDEDATTDKLHMPAGQVEYFPVSPGATVNVIQV